MITLETIKNNPIMARFFISKKSGGLNPCIVVKNQKDNKGVVDDTLDTLGNCVAFATGMFNFANGEKTCKYLGNTNAKNYVALAKKQGLTVTSEPVEGGIMVWSDSSYGHVEYVDSISANGNIAYNLASGYATYVFANKTRKRNVGGTNQWGFKTPTKYLGCINPPIKKIEFEPVKTISAGSVVGIKQGATYYNGKAIPKWVQGTNWIVKSVSGDRAVIDKSADGKYAICSPINTKYLEIK